MSIESKLAFLQETKAANAQTKAYQRLQLLFDEGTFVEIDSFTKSGDGCRLWLCRRLPGIRVRPEQRRRGRRHEQGSGREDL